MKKIFGAILALFCVSAFGTTYVPVQILNPVGSTSGQAILSNGSSSSPAWGNVPATALAAQAANTVVANTTGSSASPTAFAMPSCSTSVSALNWTTSTGFTCNTGLITAATVSSTYAPLASPALTGAPTAPTAAAGTNTTQLATTAFTQTAVTGGSNAGSFTTLNAGGNDALLYVNSSAQSIPSGVYTTVTGWAKTFDRVNSNFNAATGTFTAPATGYYQVSAQLNFGANTGAIGTIYGVAISANGTQVALGVQSRTAAGAAGNSVEVSAVVALTSGQTVVLQAFQNTGSALALSSTASQNYFNINRLP